MELTQPTSVKARSLRITTPIFANLSKSPKRQKRSVIYQ